MEMVKSLLAMSFQWFSDFPLKKTLLHLLPMVVPTIFPWLSQDFPMVFLWFSYVFPIFCHFLPAFPVGSDVAQRSQDGGHGRGHGRGPRCQDEAGRHGDIVMVYPLMLLVRNAGNKAWFSYYYARAKSPGQLVAALGVQTRETMESSAWPELTRSGQTHLKDSTSGYQMLASMHSPQGH